ncbi:GSCFA domain-containing protein [Ensifer adhaerens]|nr:GSCFA domain-containing protein [Ensifer adhaerens]
MSQKHPYRLLPEYTRWSKSISSVAYKDVDPVVSFPFTISREDKVATAGSCFAQHIARHLKTHGFNYYVVEDGHPLLHYSAGLAAKHNYGTYSARYGNVYTSRQLLQTFKRAFGSFSPREAIWRDGAGKFIDPFRPAIQPNGFDTEVELRVDREQHLAAVRRMFLELDIFVFTLGLTEFWYSQIDGAVFPVCPGVSGGAYDERSYGFGNLSVQDVVSDMKEFFSLLKEVNPSFKAILTVSPVPLAATAVNRHVLTSTTYSKSVLRVAAEELACSDKKIAYFPSYELITGNFNRGRYYNDGLRDVTEEGVDHVMRLFLKHVASQIDSTPAANPQHVSDNFYDRIKSTVETVCEEALIEASLSRPS